MKDLNWQNFIRTDRMLNSLARLQSNSSWRIDDVPLSVCPFVVHIWLNFACKFWNLLCNLAMLSLAVSCFQTFYPLDYHIFSTALVMTGNIPKLCNILNVFISEASRRVWTFTIRVTLATPWPLVVCTLPTTGATARTWSVYVATMGCRGRTCRGAEWRTRKTYNSKTIFMSPHQLSF